jgi:hypothetical protein
MSSRKKARKLARRVPPPDLIDIAQLIIGGFRIIQLLQQGAKEIEPDPDAEQIDNTETIEAEIISSTIK